MQPTVDSLIKYINRALNKNRPTLLLVQYDQDTNKAECLNLLTAQLGQQNTLCSNYDLFKDTEYLQGGLYDKFAHDSKNQKLSIISSLPLEQSGTIIDQSFLNYLNIYRDRITKHNLHIVLFIHASHMKQFIEDANDIWSFQRKTFWLESPKTEDIAPLIELLSTEYSESTDNQTADAQEVGDYLRKIQQQLEQTKTTSNKLLILINAASRVLRHNQPNISLELATKAEQLFASSKDELINEDKQEYAAKIAKQLGEIHFALGNYHQALECLKQSTEQYELNEDTTEVNLNKEAIADIYIAQGEYQNALQYLQQVLDSRLKEFDETHPDVIAAFKQIAQCYSNLEQYTQAIEYYEKLRKIYIKSHSQYDIDMASNYTSLGTCHKVTGQYELALQYYQAALIISQKIEDKHSEGISLNNISQIFFAKGDSDSALEYLNQSLTIAQQIGNKYSEGAVLNNISQIFHLRRDYNTALEYLQKSLANAKEIGNKRGQGAILNNISQIYDTKGDLETALELSLIHI